MRTLNKKSSACVIQNGHKFYFCPIMRGTRQGDPLSCYFYLICAEILNILAHENDEISGIRIRDGEYVVCQFADEVEFFLNGSERSLQATLSIFDLYRRLTGQKVNTRKTKAIWVGSMANSVHRLCTDVKLHRTTELFNVLGITFKKDVRDIGDLNFKDIFRKVKNLLRIWRRRNLNLMGRITIIKSLALSKLTYFPMNIPRPPDDSMKQIQKEFFYFI